MSPALVHTALILLVGAVVILALVAYEFKCQADIYRKAWRDRDAP